MDDSALFYRKGDIQLPKKTEQAFWKTCSATNTNEKIYLLSKYLLSKITATNYPY